MPSHSTTLLDHLRRLSGPPAADADLLLRWVHQRDEDAFAALVSRHGPMVLGVCQRVLGNAHDAEDVFQATFLILARKAASLRHPEALAGYLHAVAARLARKSRVARCRRRDHSRTLTPEPADPCPDPLDALTLRELLGLFDREISALPEVYRLPLVLCDLEGRTQEQAAHQLGWTLGSLRGRLLRGRARLKSRLTRRGLALPAGVLLPAVPLTLSASLQAASSGLTPRLIAAVSRAAVLFSTNTATADVTGPAAELARDALRVLTRTQLTIAAGAILTMSALFAGVGFLAPHAQPVEEKREDKPPSTNAAPKRAEEKPPVRLDRFGDPLPEGAVARLGTVRFRHGLNVSSVAFSPDRKTLASGGHDNTVRLWEIATSKELRRFTAYTGQGSEHVWVESIAFSPDGKFLAAATGNGPAEIVIWDLNTGKEARRLRGGKNGVAPSIAYSPDGKTLAAGTNNGSIDLWDIGAVTTLRQLKGHGDRVEGVAFSPNGETLASASRDKTIRLWDAATGRQLRQLKGHTDMVLAVAFARDGKTLASGSWDKTIRLWDPIRGAEVRSLPGHVQPVSALAFLDEDKKLASGSWDNSIRLWDIATGKELRQMRGHNGPIVSLALSVNGECLASGSWDRTVRLWDANKGVELRPTEGHHQGLWAVAISPDGKRVASGSLDGDVRLWDSDTTRGLELHQDNSGSWVPRGLIDRVEFSLDGKTVSASSWGYTRYHWEAATGKAIGQRSYKSGIGLQATSDGKFVVGTDAQGSVFVYDAATTKVLRQFKTLKQAWSLAISPDGKFLAARSPEQDGGVVVRELATGEERCRCKGAYDRFDALTFSPDGKYLAATNSPSQVAVAEVPTYLWDAATGREVRQFRGRGHHGICLAFSSDGRTLASGGGQAIRLWEVATGKERHRFQGHQGIVRSIAFSRNGARLVSASEDTTVLVWDTTGSPVAGELSSGQLRNLESNLASNDAAKAYRALWLLARHPKQSIPLLRERLPAALALNPAQRKQIERWLMDLDSDDITVRNRPHAELEKALVAAEPMMRKVLMGRPSLEQRKRIERLLELTEREHVIFGRILETLEYAAAPASRQLLETLASGEPEAWLTREAKAALRRTRERKDK